MSFFNRTVDVVPYTVTTGIDDTPRVKHLVVGLVPKTAPT